MKTISSIMVMGAVILASITGCASGPSSATPIAQDYPSATQKKIHTAQHWGAIAQDTAEQTRLALKNEDFLDGQALYVMSTTNSVFDQSFRNYMISHLVKNGVPVTDLKDDAIGIQYETQIIRHKELFDPAKSEGYAPGTASLLNAAIWVVRGAVLHWSIPSIRVGTTVSSAAFDLYKGANQTDPAISAPPTKTELMVTTSIIKDNLYKFRKTDTYYIVDEEISLFEADQILPPGAPVTLKEWKVTDK